MNLIGITGKARSGKDTVARHLVMNHDFVRLAFADPLKQAAQEIFGLTAEQTWSDDLKEVMIPRWGMTPRKIFQLLGTECMKPFFGEDMWIKRLDINYDILKDSDNVVVTDVRFDPEADYIRSKGGIIVEVRRGDGLAGEAGSHASERGLRLPPDMIIDNFGTIEDLHDAVDGLITMFGA